MLKRTCTNLFVAIVACWAGISAADGQIEINQVCAVQSGCLAGDTAGFPVTISTAGSYVLTSSLDVTTSPSPLDTTAISVTADDVAIDLAGFGLYGPQVCTGAPPTVASGTGVGISATSAARTHLRQGTVRGFGSDGVTMGPGSRVEQVTAECNSLFGIAVGVGSQINDCHAHYNGEFGLHAGAGSRVTGCVARGNAYVGLELLEGGFGGNVFTDNNGGNASPQVSLSSLAFELSSNVCGDSLSCVGVGVCGNGAIESGEVCDGSSLGGATCINQGFIGGTLSCGIDCSFFDTSSCIDPPFCGNDLAEAGEVCDGTDLNGQTCSALGFAGGTLSCTASCDGFNTAACTF